MTNKRSEELIEREQIRKKYRKDSLNNKKIEDIENSKLSKKYGTDISKLNGRKEKTLESTFMDVHLVQITKDGISVGYKIFSDKTLKIFSEPRYKCYKVKTYNVPKHITLGLALETLFSKKLLNVTFDDKNFVLLKLAPIDLEFFHHLDSIPFARSVNSLYEALNGKRKKFIESKKVV